MPRSKTWRGHTLPPQFSYDWSDLSYQEKQASGATGMTFGLSLIFVFLILAALYESWSLPFSVMLTVPIAVFGAFVGLMLRHYDLDVYGQIGIVMLIGLVGQERHPHRRVRQVSPRGSGTRWSMRRSRGRGSGCGRF